MRIVCLGGGPAGLYFAIAATLYDRRHEITVIERDPPGATYGWGVTLGEDLFDLLFDVDPTSAREVYGAAVLWQERQLRLAGHRPVWFPGHGFSAARTTLLEILSRRAAALGVQVRHGTEAGTVDDYPDADLVVAADGARSAVRTAHAEAFGERVSAGANVFTWLGTDHAFPHLTFALERTPAGPIWLHGYPSVAGLSTCVIECAPGTRDGLGLAEEDGLARLAHLFADALNGAALRSRTEGAPVWQHFPVVHNRTTVHGRVVLLGDAARTAHFSLGRGTRLAVLGAATLAKALAEAPNTAAALAHYDSKFRTDPGAPPDAPELSMAWFERMPDHLKLDPLSFASAMSGGPPRAGLSARMGQSDAARKRGRRRDEQLAAQRMAAREARAREQRAAE